MSKPDHIKWVTDDSVSKISDPGSTKKLAGLLYLERPPAQYLNWLFNRIHKWFLGLQGGYFDIVVGSSTQVAAFEATHIASELIDALVVAGSKVLFLDGTHILVADLSLTNADVTLIGETSSTIVDVATFQILLTGERTNARLRVTNAGADDIQLSGAGSKFIGIDVAETAVKVTGGASAETTGANPVIKHGDDNAFNSTHLILPPTTAGISTAYTIVWGIASLVTDRVYSALIHVTNTGTCTVNPDGIGATSIKLIDGSELLAGQLRIGMHAHFKRTATELILLNPMAYTGKKLWATASLTSSALITSSDASLATFSVGQVNAGDIIDIQIPYTITKGGVAGNVTLSLTSSTGPNVSFTSIAPTIQNALDNITASNSVAGVLSGKCVADSSGVLVMDFRGQSAGSNSTVNASQAHMVFTP